MVGFCYWRILNRASRYTTEKGCSIPNGLNRMFVKVLSTTREDGLATHRGTVIYGV